VYVPMRNLSTLTKVSLRSSAVSVAGMPPCSAWARIASHGDTTEDHDFPSGLETKKFHSATAGVRGASKIAKKVREISTDLIIVSNLVVTDSAVNIGKRGGVWN